MPGHGNNNDYNDESLYEIINLQDDPQVRVQTQLRIVHGPQWMDLNGQWFMKFEVIKLARLTKRSITSTKGLNVVFPVGISVRVRSEAKNHTWTGKSQWAHTQVGWSMLLFVSWSLQEQSSGWSLLVWSRLTNQQFYQYQQFNCSLEVLYIWRRSHLCHGKLILLLLCRTFEQACHV